MATIAANRFLTLARSLGLILSLLLVSTSPVRADDAGPLPDTVKAAVAKSLPLLEAGAKGSLEKRKQCFTCHNQGLPIMALTLARSRGFVIDDENLRQQVQFTADFLGRNKDKYKEGRGQGGQVDTAGYALWTLSHADWKPDDTTAAVVEYLLKFQQDEDHYEPQSRRPPTEQSHFTSSFVALRGLKAFGLPEHRDRINARVKQVLDWLRQTKAEDTEDRVFRLRGLHVAGAAADDVSQAKTELLSSQQPDGGWSQLPDGNSDAYATATALVALHQAGALATDDPAYRKGLSYLIGIQKEDGSWHVATRSKPIQTYFESGYPHGKDQFISIAAASWATTALALALPAVAVPDPTPRQALWRKLEPFTRPPAEYAGQFGNYRSPLKFSSGDVVKTADDCSRRRAEILALWQKRLGAWPPLVEQPAVKKLETIERDGYTQHHVHVQISPEGQMADGYLLVPPGQGPFPAVFVPFYEPLTSIGEGTKGQGTHDYGRQLAQRGFVTLSIGTPGSLDKIGVDTRQLQVEAGKQYHRQPLTLLAYTAANCHTALARMPEVDPARIGIIGLSYGGKWSMFASCLYDKFACAVWSDPGIVFDEKNANVNYWEPWYLGFDRERQRKPGVPTDANPRTGLYKELIDAGEDLVDLHALMAPRPLLVSGGTEDPPQNWRALNHLVAVNAVLGQTQRVAMTARPSHIPTPQALELELEFLEYWLKPDAKK